MAGAKRTRPGAFLKGATRMEAAASTAVSATLTAIEQGVKGAGPHPAPYRTGALRRSYHRTQTSPTSGRVGNDPGIAPYAKYVEFGTSKMAAQPHLLPTAEMQREPFKERLAAAVMAAVKR